MTSKLSRRSFVQAAAVAAASGSATMLAACGGSGNGGSDAVQTGAATTSAATASGVTLNVFAAASLTESLQACADAFTQQNGAALSFNFDSSGTLKTQIQEGAEADVFISAGQKQMNQLDAEDTTGTNTEGLDLIDHSTRFDILENEVTLVVPEGNPKGIANFEDLKSHLQAGDVKLAMGNSDVPVGQYTQKILQSFGLDEAQLASSGVITYGSNVKEVTTQVSEAAVDCGIIYRTDAVSAGLTVVDVATKDMTGGRVVYPAAMVKNSANAEAAKAYLEFLKGSDATAEFEKVGFKPLASEGQQ